MPASRRPPHLALPGEPLYCPNGHKLDHDIWPVGEHPQTTQRCDFRIPPGNAGVCGVCVYWLMLPGGIRLAVEVTSSEAHHMQQERMSVKEVLAFLNLRWQRSNDVPRLRTG